MATTTGALGQNITPKSDVSSRRELRFAVFDRVVEVPRIMVGYRQTIDTLISEEALLFAKFLRFERETWIPRVVTFDIKS